MTNCATGILDALKFLIEKLFYVLEIWVLVLKKHMTLKFGYPQKINIEKFQAVHLVVHSKQEE